MSVGQMILAALKDVILAFTPTRSMREALIKFDFKLGLARQNLMQLCFSPLANVPLILLLAIIWLDPVQGSIFFQDLLGESQLAYFLLDGRTEVMLMFTVVFFLLEMIFGLEYLWIAIVFFFMSKYLLHIHLAVAAVIGVYLSRTLSLFLLQTSLASQTKKIWQWISGLQLGATIVAAILSLVALDQLEKNRFFSASISANRIDFLFLVVLGILFLQFVASALWGHFNFQKQADPTFLPVYFSTATWLKRFKPRPLFKARLQEKIVEATKSHTKSAQDLQNMKDQSLGVRLGSLETTLTQELDYLQRAASALTTPRRPAQN